MASNIDLKGILKTRQRTLRARFARELASALYAEWFTLASQLKPRYQEPYHKAMSMYVMDNKIIIELDYAKAGKDADFVRAIEYGFGGGGVGTSGHYDMRDTLLKNAHKENSRGYKYRDIPMKMGADKVSGFGGQSAVDAARKLAFYRGREERKAAASRYRLPAGMADIIHPNQREVVLGAHGRVKVPSHATDPLAGMYRFNKKGHAEEFGIFRRISEDPETGKPWVGAPIKQHRLMRRLKRRLPRIIEQVKAKRLA